MTTEEIQNIYASTVNNIIIYIDEAESGRNGYFCLGCEREMQAVKSQIQGRKHYFRHDAEANKSFGKCTYSDETYRHKLAKETLQILKRIKVPALLKHRPDGNGKALMIRPAEYIEADTVSIELQFYENDEGIVKWGRNLGDDKRCLIKPDVTFFDSSGNPILLIEIVVTHKLTEEKVVKVRRLGIDTISITIPKDSPEAIERVFSETTRTKWIYNYERENTPYISLSESNAEAIQHLDEDQKRDFKFTLNCRQSEIRDLIRRIKRCLESEQYRDIEQRNRQELQRIKENADKFRRDIEAKAERNTEYISKDEGLAVREHTESRIAIHEALRKVSELQEDEGNKYNELEKRYIDKSRELRKQQEATDNEIRRIEDAQSRARAIIDRGTADDTGQKGTLSGEISRIEGFIRAERERLERIANDKELLPTDFERNKEYQKSEHSRIEADIKEQVRRDEDYRSSLRAKYEDIEVRVRAEFNDRSSEIFATDNGKTFDEIPEFVRGVEAINHCIGQADIVEKSSAVFKRYKHIKELLESGSLKIRI